MLVDVPQGCGFVVVSNSCYVVRQAAFPVLDGVLQEAVFSDGILPSSVSNLRWDYHNPLPTKLVHTLKINLRRLVILLENSQVALRLLPCEQCRVLVTNEMPFTSEYRSLHSLVRPLPIRFLVGKNSQVTRW